MVDLVPLFMIQSTTIIPFLIPNGGKNYMQILAFSVMCAAL